MIISHSHKFIFVHIPKTAGMSITEVFGKYNYNRTLLNRFLSFTGIYPKIFFENFRHEQYHNRRHLTSSHIKQQLDEFGYSEIFNNYFKFSFVRNPFASMVSSYKYVMASADPSHISHKSPDFINMRTNYNTFEKFLNFRIKLFPISFYSYLYDEDGNCLVDFVGKVENIQDDINRICEKVNLPNLLIPHVNTSKTYDYKIFYDEKLINQMLEAYEKDFELFGYSKNIDI